MEKKITISHPEAAKNLNDSSANIPSNTPHSKSTEAPARERLYEEKKRGLESLANRYNISGKASKVETDNNTQAHGPTKE